ncbi:MAG: hypothetical protein WCJ30_22005, partial [Deltaproteobacteria bacterium]
MDAAAAAQKLEQTLGTLGGPVTIADAATRSGLPLREAERGLHWLTREYRGHLRVTNDGDLLFLFPHGFTRPWVVPTALGNAARAVGRGAKKVVRFALRAWLSIVMLLYVLAFVAVLVVMLVGSSTGSDDRKSSSKGGGLLNVIGGMLRMLAEVMFWTSRPGMYGGYGYGSSSRISRSSSWFRRDDDDDDDDRRAGDDKDKTPFHERVNQYVFGPPAPPDASADRERAILAQIRAGKGRVGLADVMRVTGLPREQVDGMMARLMVDYDGEVDVSQDGGIAYRFEALRKTAETDARDRPGSHSPPDPFWNRAVPAPALTGNTAGTNAAIVGLNGFNLLMGWFAFSSHLTIENVQRLFSGVRIYALPQEGAAIVLGLVPMLFSLAILAAPVLRAPTLPFARARARFENGRKAVTDTVLARVKARRPVLAQDLVDAWKRATGAAPDQRTLTRVVVSLGGDVDLAAAERASAGAGVRYRFDDLEL